jgi:hypothetical protein
MKKILAHIKQILGIVATVQKESITTNNAPAILTKIEEEVKEVVAKPAPVAKPKGNLAPLEEAPKAPAKKKKKYYKPKPKQA